MSIILVQRASTVSGMEAEPSALRSREREAAACIHVYTVCHVIYVCNRVVIRSPAPVTFLLHSSITLRIICYGMEAEPSAVVSTRLRTGRMESSATVHAPQRLIMSAAKGKASGSSERARTPPP